MYKDRGIIKWAPFDALVGFGKMLDELKYNREKRDQPILSEDQKAIMYQNIIYALQFKEEVTIIYYVDGYFKEVFGKIKKVDEINKNLVLDTKMKISINTIIDLKVDKDYV